jgi:monoamine oxidase
VELRAEERGLSISELHARYHRSAIMEGPARLLEPGFPQDEFLQYDAISLAEHWRRNGASEGAVRLMRLGYYDLHGEGVESVSALQFGREAASFVGVTGAFQVKGGNDRICAALASRLPGRVLLDSPVVLVRQDGNGVRITIEQRGTRQEISGDYAIVTVPPQVLSRIAFEPALSPLRARAFREVRGTDVTRVFVQTRTRFWEEQGLEGSAVTDLPIGAVYHSSVAQPGPRGILESYSCGERARVMARLSDEQQLSATRSALGRVFPGLDAQAERGTSYRWGEDPWARGSHPVFAPGQIGTFFQALQRPEGRVYFAGDLVGGVPGYSHAAFGSGRRVAEQIAAL